MCCVRGKWNGKVPICLVAKKVEVEREIRNMLKLFWQIRNKSNFVYVETLFPFLYMLFVIVICVLQERKRWMEREEKRGRDG